MDTEVLKYDLLSDKGLKSYISRRMTFIGLYDERLYSLPDYLVIFQTVGKVQVCFLFKLQMKKEVFGSCWLMTSQRQNMSH